MCTVSWTFSANGYDLLCNRDEKRTRAQAVPPCVHTESKLRIVSPRDPEGGGTWIASNSLGISVALLNGSTLGETDDPIACGPAKESRGKLPARLIRLGSVDVIWSTVETTSLSGFLPFTLLVLAPGEPALLFAWDGRDRRSFTDSAASGFISSSSLDPRGVRHHRHAAFDSLRRRASPVNPELLYGFHESHGPAPSAYSPCMHRPDAETVSFSWIRVDAAEVSFFYTPSAPCHWSPGETRRIPRIQ
jgi:hypothetical protein